MLCQRFYNVQGVLPIGQTAVNSTNRSRTDSVVLPDQAAAEVRKPRGQGHRRRRRRTGVMPVRLQDGRVNAIKLGHYRSAQLLGNTRAIG